MTNKETVIALAREAGLKVASNISGVLLVGSPLENLPSIAHIDIDEMHRFADLVAAHEREECAKVCDEEANDLSCGEDWNDCGRYLARTIRSRT